MDGSSYSIPILFVFFNRKEIALKAFEKIKKAKPQKIYLASDGYRSHVQGEKERVEDIRNTIFQQIDWECDIKTLYQQNNLGCGTGVFTAIDWLFKHEERGIILEDDCVVQDSFFPFIEELLEKYENDFRIGMIDGANYIRYEMENSYCFSRYKSTNGWATWRRAWQNMDMDMKWRKTSSVKSILKNMGYCGKDVNYWKYRLKAIDKKHASAWDWQWYFTLASQNQLSVFPNINLVSNIGFGAEATHTTEKEDEKYLAKNELKFPLIHPQYVVPDTDFDNAFYKNNDNFIDFIRRCLPFGLKNKLKKLLR